MKFLTRKNWKKNNTNELMPVAEDLFVWFFIGCLNNISNLQAFFVRKVLNRGSTPIRSKLDPCFFWNFHNKRSGLVVATATQMFFFNENPVKLGKRIQFEELILLKWVVDSTTNYEHISKKVTTDPWSIPQAIPRSPTMKGFTLQPVGKGVGVCSKGVLKQP